MLDWLIVGGGVHGTHLSLVLTKECGVPRDRLRVLDPHEAPLARWEACTGNVGMAVLRSPYVHQIDTHPFALRQFARRPEARGLGGLQGFYRRPALALFAAHCRHVVEENDLAALRLRGTARGLHAHGAGFRVDTEHGAIEARRVLLAVSMADRPAWPEWARALRAAGAAVDHVFDEGFRRADLPPWEHAVVVGGGITAAQAAVAMGAERPGTVTLLARHAMRIRPFDSDPGWLGPRYQAGFHREPDPDRRRAVIARARHRGSMPPEVAAQLRAALVRKDVRLRTAKDVVEARAEEGRAVLALADGGELRADRVLLCTGFEAGRPGGAWLDEAVERLGLRCAACGFPVVDRALRWAPGLHVTGPLAELEVGPVSRNIVGARIAAERLRAPA